MSEQTIGVRELKNKLSQVLRQVKAGQVVVITERGKPIGRILPVEKSLEERMQALVEAGILKWNGQKLEQREPVAINTGERQISDLVSEGRDIDYLPGHKRTD